MRAREFTINIPINIVIDQDDCPQVKSDSMDDNDSGPVVDVDPVDDETGTFIPPLQQKIELLKKTAGVKSAFDPEDDDEIMSPQDHPTPFDTQADDDEPLE